MTGLNLEGQTNHWLDSTALHFQPVLACFSCISALVPFLFLLTVPNEFEPTSTYSSTGVLGPLSHSLFRGHHPGGRVGLSHCAWLMQGPCLLEAVVKETLCLGASTDPLPKLGPGPLSACLTGGVVGVWNPNLLQWLDTEMKGVDLEKFKGRVSLSTPTSFFFSLFFISLPPVNLFLSLPDVLHSVSMPPFFPVFYTNPDWEFVLFIPILCCCIFVCVSLSAAGQLQVNWLKETGGQKPTAQ